MIYEKLLNKIQEEFAVPFGVKQFKMLLAIMEIHKPDEFNTHCKGCEATPYESCLTIQAIEKELN